MGIFVMRWVVCIAILAGVITDATGEPSIYLRSTASPHTLQSALELQRVFFVATDTVLPLTTRDRVGAEAEGFVIGAAGELPTGVPPYPMGLEEPSGDGFVVAELGSLRVISARDSRALMNGVAHLSDRLGLGIAIDQIVQPAAMLDADDGIERAVAGSHSPRHAVRGVSPALDVPFGAAAWDVGDWKSYVDAARLMGFNTLYLDLHDDTPFAGTVAQSRTLRSSATGNPGLGVGAYFADTDDSLFGMVTPARAQPILSKASVYAANRGMKVVASIEVSGNPLIEEAQVALRSRLAHLAKTYRGVDTFVLRLRDAGGVFARAHDPLGEYARAWVSDFGSENLDATRLVIFATLARQYLATVDGTAQVAVAQGDSGMDAAAWRGVLSLVDVEVRDCFVSVTTTQESAGSVGVLDIESNAGLWLPHPTLRAAEQGMAAVADAGYVLAHITMRESAMALRYLASQSWTADNNRDRFLEDYAARFLLAEEPAAVAEQLSVFESIQPFGGGPTGRRGAYARAPITFDSGEGRTYADALSALAGSVGVAPALHGVPGAKPDLVNDGINAVLSVGTAPLRIFSGKRGGDAAFGDPLAGVYARLFYALPLAQTMARASGAETDVTRLVPAMHLFAHDMRSRTDLGLLYSMATALLSGTDSSTEPPESLRDLRPVWLMPNRVIAITPGDPSDVAVVLRYRVLGESRWEEVACRSLGNYSYEWNVPSDIRGAVIEYGVEIQNGLRTVASAPYGFPSKVATRTIHGEGDTGRRTPVNVGRSPIALDVGSEPSGANTLRWSTIPGENYALYRNGKLVVTTPMPFYVDTPIDDAKSRYELIARDVARDETRSVIAMAPATRGPLPSSPTTLEIISRGGGAILSWIASDSGVILYEVSNLDGDSEEGPRVLPADPGHQMRISVAVPSSDSASFQVTGIGAGGARAATSPSAGIFVNETDIAPTHSVDLDSPAFFERVAALTEAGVFLGGPGLTEGPNPTPLQEDTRLTISAWVYLDTTRGRPVLISRGLWPEPQLKLRLRRGILELDMEDGTRIRGGSLTANAWHHVALVVAGDVARIYLDGKQTARGTRGIATTPLTIADGDLPVSALITRGTFERIRVFDVALTAEEVARLLKQNPPTDPPQE